MLLSFLLACCATISVVLVLCGWAVINARFTLLCLCPVFVLFVVISSPSVVRAFRNNVSLKMACQSLHLYEVAFQQCVYVCFLQHLDEQALALAKEIYQGRKLCDEVKQQLLMTLTAAQSTVLSEMAKTDLTMVQCLCLPLSYAPCMSVSVSLCLSALFLSVSLSLSSRPLWTLLLSVLSRSSVSPL